MMIFWYDGYDYEVDLEELKERDMSCYIWDTMRGWLLITLEVKSGTLRWVKKERVDSRPEGSLIARHAGSASWDVRVGECTTSNKETNSIEP